MGKTKCVKDFPCEECGNRGLLQILTAKYSRVRHYSHLDPNTKRPQFIYHRNSMAYVTEKLRMLSAKSLSSSLETQVIATGIKVGSDQIGHERTIDQNLKESSQKLENSLCRGSLAWLGRQTHNLERKGTRRPNPEVAGSKLEKSENPAPGTTHELQPLP